MKSADHFEKEIPMNLTGLAEVLQSVQDNVFTVGFRRQPTEESAAKLLEEAGKHAFKDAT